MLIAAGADVNGSARWLPFKPVVLREPSNVVPNVRWYADGYEMPVLGIAFMKEGNLEAARMLLDAGADVNAKFK